MINMFSFEFMQDLVAYPMADPNIVKSNFRFIKGQYRLLRS